MNDIKQLHQQWQSLQPLKTEDQTRLDRKFMLEFNYNSNHIEGNTLTYGQTEQLLLFGKAVDVANMKDLEDMKASNLALNMMKEQAASEYPLTESFIRQLHHTLLRDDYKVYRQLPGGETTSYTVHAGRYKTRPNSVITPTGEKFEYASPEETPALMTDLVAWYREAEHQGVLSVGELCSLFHYRYIRIHPFEDGNGRIARLLVNYILLRHKYPMIVIKSADKSNYLNTLNVCDSIVGFAPSAGALAAIGQIRPLVTYIENCMARALTTCIRAAKGQSIEEDDDFLKELKILERQKKQDLAVEQSKKRLSADEVWNVLEFVFFPIVEGYSRAIEAVREIFRFSSTMAYCYLSKNSDYKGGLNINRPMRGTTDTQILDFVNHAKSMWFRCEMTSPTHPHFVEMDIEIAFYVKFFENHYFVDGMLNKNFAYGTYPTSEERERLVSQFKQNLLKELKEKL